MSERIIRFGNVRAIVLLGGPMHKISVGGKVYEFEFHSYVGPTILNRHGDPCKNQPLPFLEAASLWAQQGKRVDKKTGLCVWERESQPITKHIGGRHHLVVGWTKPEPGR